MENQSYFKELKKFNEKERMLIYHKGAGQPLGSKEQNANANPSSQTQQQTKTLTQQQAPKQTVVMEKPKVLLTSNFLKPKHENTLIKNYINFSTNQLLEMFPSQNIDCLPLLNSPLIVKRTPYFQRKYNPNMGVFMKSLKEAFGQECPKSEVNRMIEQLFEKEEGEIGRQLDLLCVERNDNLEEQFWTHSLRKQVFAVGDLIDEVSDSLYQNTIFVMEETRVKRFNPASLSVSFANMRILEKSGSVQDLPRITFVHLGILEQELNKKCLFFNPRGKKPEEYMSNLQYISMFHSDEEREVGLAESYSQNCIDIVMNEFTKNNDQEKAAAGEKYPKTIGSSEFICMFDLVIKQVRLHQPQVVLFAYDFSLTRAHNHCYDLKSDALGYLCYMLSQISNHHVIFLANTSNENHLSDADRSKRLDFFGLDACRSLDNYVDKNKATEFKDEKSLIEFASEIKNAQPQDSVTNLRDHSIYFSKKGIQQEESSKLQELAKTLLAKYAGEAKSDLFSFIENKFYDPEKFKYGTAKEFERIAQLTLSMLIHNKQLYKCIQEQFYSVIFGLLERINYKKIIANFMRKTSHSVESGFLKSISNQIRSRHIFSRARETESSYRSNVDQQKQFQYMTKFKQMKHISKFVAYSNEQRMASLLGKSIALGYTCTPLSEIVSEEDMIDSNKNSLISNVSLEEMPVWKRNIFTNELKVRTMLKRYTSALLNNWVFDIRNNQKIYLFIQSNKLEQFRFFFTERSQYVIDYEQDNSGSLKTIIYFFNVQRGSVFKNFILVEITKNLFQQCEIQWENPFVYDFMWKNIRKIQQMRTEVDQFPASTNDLKHSSLFIHRERLEDLEMFNTALCMTSRHVYRFFGDLVNPKTWKQTEYSLMISILPRIKFSDTQKPFQMSLLNSNVDFFSNTQMSIPRTGCTAVSHDRSILVFGGFANSGFLHNAVEEYEIMDDKGNIRFSRNFKKKINSKASRPLFAPLTFLLDNKVYLVGGEYGNNYISRGLKQVYFQCFSIESQQFSIVHTIPISKVSEVSEIAFSLQFQAPERKNHHHLFLQDIKFITFTSTNLNQFYSEETQSFQLAIAGKASTAIEQILETSTLITINPIAISKCIETSEKIDPLSFSCVTTIEDERNQQLKLCDYNSSNTFFISVFPDQSNFSQVLPPHPPPLSNKPTLVAGETTECERVAVVQHALSNSSTYLEHVNKEYHIPLGNGLFLPKYILTMNGTGKMAWTIKVRPDDVLPTLLKQFEFSIRIENPDFNGTLLSNDPHFLTYQIDFKKETYKFYKTFSFEECAEFEALYPSQFNFGSNIFYNTIKFNQKKMVNLNLFPYSDELELISPLFVNRYISADETHIYLINGCEFKDHYQAYNKVSPCERVSIKNKTSEKINSCIFLPPDKSTILANEEFIFYIGIYNTFIQGIEIQMKNSTLNDDGEDYSELLIAQVLSKKSGCWTTFNIKSKQITKQFQNYKFILGKNMNTIAAIQTKTLKKSNEHIACIEITFELNSQNYTINTVLLPYVWTQNTIQVIPSAYYSATIYTTTFNQNPPAFKLISMIPPSPIQS